MNCATWEERIALYAGGDLKREETAGVERHLAECPGCQIFASGLMEAMGAMRSAHAEEISPAHYTALRARVLAAVERERRGWRRLWVYAAAAALALVAVGVGLRMRVADLPAV